MIASSHNRLGGMSCRAGSTALVALVCLGGGCSGTSGGARDDSAGARAGTPSSAGGGGAKTGSSGAPPVMVEGGRAGAANGGAAGTLASGGGRNEAGAGGAVSPAAGGAAGGASAGGGAGGASAPDGWKLSWSDEFDGGSGEKPDGTKWGYDLGGDGWGNNELQYYTDRPENAATDGQGHLVITLKAEKLMNRDYTSARLITLGKFSQTYGRFEARVRAPTGQGVWPAFWMLGADIQTKAWPECGEIDIMEIAGKAPGVNHGSLHGPGYSGGNPLTAKYTLPSGALTDDFHVYAVEWEENRVRWYVDTNLYQTRTNAEVPSGGAWVYDHPFFMILNVAMGGTFGGAPDATTVLPQSMIVDYVRVYERE